MNQEAVWELLANSISASMPCALLAVVAHEGSTPGRTGFLMGVTLDGQMAGSIGGGMMEQKLVTYAMDRLSSGQELAEWKRQIHSKDAPTDQSGMICSGEQTVLFKRIRPDDLPHLQLIQHADHQHNLKLVITRGTFSVEEHSQAPKVLWVHEGPDGWRFELPLYQRPRIVVVGGGHVGLAVCRQMHLLGWYVINVDDRPGLNTMESNTFAHEKHVVDYEKIGEWAGINDSSYVLLVSFGYRTDETCLRQLLGRPFPYLGMMGSKAKIEAMMAQLRADGYAENLLSQVRTPAGVPINSQTPAEIAVSISAELISVYRLGNKTF